MNINRIHSQLSISESIRLDYVIQGPCHAPPVLFVPGPTDSWHSYLPALDALPTSVRAVALSPRGHGDSDKPADGYGIRDLAADLSQALSVLDLQRPVLVGYSGSCLVVRRLALDYPRLVAGLVLEASPAAMIEHPAFANFVTGSLALLRDPIDHDFIAQFVRNGATSHAETRRAEEEINEVAKVPAHVWQRLFTGMLEYDDRADLPRITCPVLLLWGDADPLVEGSVQQRLATRMPRARLIIFPGAGHSPRLDSPQRFADEVARFMSQLDR